MYSKTEPESNPFLAGMAAIQAAQEFHVWPENMPAINLFSSISSQWRTGPGGATGLDYNVLFHRMDHMHLSEQDYEWMFDDIRVIESAALTSMNKKDD
jgi:hypothetical protein